MLAFFESVQVHRTRENRGRDSGKPHPRTNFDNGVCFRDYFRPHVQRINHFVKIDGPSGWLRVFIAERGEIS
jgi:hypothetical protein